MRTTARTVHWQAASRVPRCIFLPSALALVRGFGKVACQHRGDRPVANFGNAIAYSFSFNIVGNALDV